ncbi:MAG TPA: thiamine pyrophosphate-dependent enzyme, partial [Candidatus Binatia bacterium]|nr:thiamine pyrophosphate-dependent enzyme [Candidatus Binatia bacterium]
MLEQSKRANVGHIGSALSIADIVATLYSGVLYIRDPDDPGRDRFVLSKGHAVLAVYAALALRGWLPETMLATYCGDGTLLGVHPDRALRGVDFTTGSLGQGLSIGAGAALAARLQGRDHRVFVLVSDAECNEGALWEAVMFAAHHRLSRLVAIVDLNGQQALGYTDDVLSLSPLAARWRSFGWDVHEVDGHDGAALAHTIAALDTTTGPPHVLVAR